MKRPKRTLTREQQRSILIAAGALIALLAIFLPGYLSRRAQLNKIFAVFDALEAQGPQSGAGIFRDHKLLEARAEIDRMEQLSPGFRESPAGKNLLETMAMMQPNLGSQEFVSDKDHYLKFSEIEFDSPTEDDWNSFQKRRNAPGTKEEDILYLLQPRVPASRMREAYEARAKSHLQNARILTGRAKGELYTPPAPRQEYMWKDALPPMHPRRNQY